MLTIPCHFRAAPLAVLPIRIRPDPSICILERAHSLDFQALKDVNVIVIDNAVSYFQQAADSATEECIPLCPQSNPYHPLWPSLFTKRPRSIHQHYNASCLAHSPAISQPKDASAASGNRVSASVFTQLSKLEISSSSRYICC